MTTDGYACSRCGAWVYSSQTHTCSVTYTARMPDPWTREDVQTVIRLLKEIEYHLRTKR
jgi:ribosomal protein L37E